MMCVCVYEVLLVVKRLMMQVVVVESRDRIGGRVCDDLVNGAVVGRGAQLINGCINNPFALICHQVICHH